MEMSSFSGARYLARLHNVTSNVMAQKLMWAFHEQVSHKLKTPLAKLTGFLCVLRDDRSMLSETERENILATVDRSATELRDEILSIFQYLDVLKMGGLNTPHYSLAEIPAIIAEITTGLELEAVAVSFEDFENPADIYLPISGKIIELVLWELLKNAKKFHPKQLPALEIILSAVPGGVRFQISDDGLTLSPEQLTRMWIPYYQAEKYFSGQVPGMGLGLSMVASLVWNAAGSCRAFNRPDGPGIVVELVLPVGRFK